MPAAKLLTRKEMLSDHDKACVLSLVHAHVCDGEEYTSWVPAYTALRRSGAQVLVGGHFRRKALYRNLLKSLVLVTKFEHIAHLPPLSAPPRAAKRRWDENGRTIPLRDRQLEFF